MSPSHAGQILRPDRRNQTEAQEERAGKLTGDMKVERVPHCCNSTLGCPEFVKATNLANNMNVILWSKQPGATVPLSFPVGDMKE